MLVDFFDGVEFELLLRDFLESFGLFGSGTANVLDDKAFVGSCLYISRVKSQSKKLKKLKKNKNFIRQVTLKSKA